MVRVTVTMRYLNSETINKAVWNSKIYIIYRIHENVERQLRLSGNTGKTETLPKHEDITLNSMT